MPKAIPVMVKVRKRSNRSTKSIVVKPCVCDKCGQESNAQPDTTHAVCQGFRLLVGKALPPLFKNLRGKPGIWRLREQAPALAETG